MKKTFNLLFLLCGLAVLPVSAQVAIPPPMPDYQPLSPEQLDQMLGPIALYPDPLMAQILPASTLPTEIVLADRYVTGGGDPNQVDQQPWDPSVQALAHYPNVLQWMDQNLGWTTEIGQAFVNQQQDVMDSVQRLRTSAYNLGNLQSTPQQEVVSDGGDVEILPTDPEVVYLPSYQPDEVYYQGGFGLSFGTPFPIGIWLNCDFDWHHRHLIVWNHDHPRPHDWWHERPNQRDAVFAGHTTTVWHPVNRPGSTAGHRGDRGWNNPVGHSQGPVVNHPEQRPHDVPGNNRPGPDHNPAINHPGPDHSPVINRPGPAHPPVVNRPEPIQHPAPVQHEAPISRPSASSGPFIGIQSSHDTRDFSNRGQQSMGTVTHSAPVSRPAPSGNPGGGGGNRGGGGGGGGGRH
jgi:hypothetical protein